MNRFLDQLARRVLVFDGAMGTATHCHDLSCEHDYLGRENCPEILTETKPDIVSAIHESFLSIGADAIETNTFGANPIVFAEFDLVDKTHALNKAAAELARAACAKYETIDKPRFVIGSMGPGTKLITLGHTTWDELFESYREQARGLLDGGVDVLLIETSQDLLQVKCTINAALAALDDRRKTTGDVPIMVQVTIETTGTMLLGTEIAAAASALRRYPIASLGLNCATGPDEMAEHVRWLGRHWDRLVSVIPNAGLPALVDGKTEYPLPPEPFARSLLRFVEQDGANIVGGCCGTTPEHIARVIDLVGTREPGRPDKQPPKPACTSLYSVTELRQDTSILNIGERTNASGSRRFKRLLEEENWDEMVSLARQQVREGSHVIDVNVDYAGRDGARDMGKIVRRFVRQVNVPIMLDSTQPATIEAGLKHAGGNCLINSANLEDGEERFAILCRLARKYQAVLVLGTIDEDPQEAMARTADRKVAIALRMVELATNQHGLSPQDLVIDPLVLPISTGMDKDRRSGLETIEGVRRISGELPMCQTTVGLSNISFGLRPSARHVLNSVFLHELIEAGLASAILHVSKILPRTRIDDAQWAAAVDLVYDRHPSQPVTLRDGAETTDPLQIFVDLFDEDQASAKPRAALEVLSLEQRMQRHIIDGEKRNLIDTLDESLKQYSPLDIINDHLLDGMKVVGDLFGSGQMQLPFVLQSAEVMKMAVEHLEQFMDKVQVQSKGSIVLATVKGDVHDIGKNLVDIILTNNGYMVHNLGIKQPIGAIIDQWQQCEAGAIGLSGLLVKSVAVMKDNLVELNERGINVPVILGGAALSRHYCESELRDTYHGSVYYGKDAFEGLRIMEVLAAGGGGQLDDEIVQRRDKRAAVKVRVEAASEGGGDTAVAVLARSQVAVDVQVPTAPFMADRVVADIDLEQVYAYLNLTALFRGQWQFRKGSLSDQQYQAQLEDNAMPILERLKGQCRDEGILRPGVAYGYFPCNSDGDDLIIFDPADPHRRVEQFTFPRQSSRKRLCISDYFRSLETGQQDVIGLACVTVGQEVSRRAKKLFDQNNYADYLYLHGFGVECAEALAELWHKRMRQELGIAGHDKPTVRQLFAQGYRGSRYSFGYPACPDMADQQKLFRLLSPQRIGCTLTENFQIDPEQSTSAIIVHHPEAKYFNI